MKRIIITLCICTAWVASTYAQYPYTLKKCLEEGLANNYSIRITRNEEQISHNNATLANAGYLPTVDLSAGYTGTLDNTDTKSRSTGTSACTSAFGIRIVQRSCISGRQINSWQITGIC